MKTRLLFILLLLNFAAFAQVSDSDSPYSVKTTLSNDFVLIGDRVGLTISVLVPESCKVTFPALSDSLMKGIELVSKPTLETVKLKNKQNEQIMKLLITSFDSGSYQLPELRIAVSDGIKTDTVLSKPLTLVVNTIPRDKAVKDIMDIKPPIEEPLTIKEVAPWAFGGLLFAALIFLLIIYLKRRRENRPFSFLQKHVDPPHVIALRELEKIKEEKLYISENHKYYYTRLIDTLRIYIEGRYEVNAMEQTTDEILFGLKGVGFPVDEQYKQLQETLILADLVKFAKYTPFVSDNENSLKVAFDFVEKTKPIEEVKETVIIEEVKNDKVEEVAGLSNEQDNKTLS
ncbi:MAG: hypothetical protein EHM93_08695 [Bacteroidales bacterium]|jgi:hypothetical protein|nr:MAG: hypothetical protein EHM93_08695 [Bacteroidales bacterium]